VNGASVRILYRHELRMLLRDRRTVFLSIVLPLILFPVTLYGMKYARERREQRLHTSDLRYAIAGSWAAEARRLLASSVGKETAADGYRLQEVLVSDAAAELREKKIDVYVEALDGADADARANAEPAGSKSDGKDGPIEDGDRRTRWRAPGTPLVRLHFQADRDSSGAARRRLGERLEQARAAAADARLAGHGFTLGVKAVFPVEETSLATPAQVTGGLIGRGLTLLLVMLMLTGGVSVSADSIAGEKERGTLETLLTTAAGRAEIVSAKQLVIFSVMCLITVIQLANMAVYLWLRVIRLPGEFVVQVAPLDLLALALLFVPLAALLSAVLLALSGQANSYKETQLYFLPVYLLSLLPAAAGAMPGLELRSAVAFVPIANVSVAAREILLGRCDWLMVLLVSLVTTGYAAMMLRRSAKRLSAERLIGGGPVEGLEHTGGPALLPHRVLRWYGLMWVVIFTMAANASPGSGLRRQLLFNQSVMLAVPLLVAWRYRVPLREALALRRVPPVTWLAVLLAVPAGNVLAHGVFRLASYVFPVPHEMLDRFGEALMPRGISRAELYVLIAVLPGICEEIAFRGVLLYGLSKRLRPPAVVLAVGGIFGLFHVDLFRLLPTAALGMLLTTMALLTGSIFPGMVAHVANNAFAIWAGKEALPLGQLDAWVYVGAAVVFGLCLWILYRTGTPYPGQRPWRERRMTPR
jgi:sodium transport system permease protein